MHDVVADRAAPLGETRQRRSLVGACLAHLLHDGYTDQLYALLPVWQSEFGLSYAGLAVVRALYYATMAGFQIPAERLTSKLSSRAILSAATLIAAGGYLVASLPFGFAILCVGLVCAGLGSSLQHPRASHLVAASYGTASRGPLGIYNFAGDLGKAIFPATVALLLPLIAWRSVVALTAVVGLLVAVVLLVLLPSEARGPATPVPSDDKGGDGGGFSLLIVIGAFDTSTRMGYLLFLPFLLRAKGSHEATVGIGLALLFAGGALGKAFCGWLGQRLGVVWSVIATEALTAVFMVTTLLLPLSAMLAILPFLGIVLNGTSSVLYGTVPELARKDQASRAFALFYTGVIGAGGLAPIAYGWIADNSSRTVGIIASALTAAAIIPMVLALKPLLTNRILTDA